MKAFRLIRTVLLTVFLYANFSACSSDPIIPEVTIEMGSEDYFAKNMDFDSTTGEKTFSFNSNVDWTIDVSATRNGSTWCTATPNSGKAGANTVRIKVQENTSYDDRSVVLTLTAGSSLTKTITITQKQTDALLLTTNKFEVGPKGGKIYAEVKSNIEFEAIIPDAYKSWISQGSSSRGLSTSNLSFDIKETEEVDKREGEIIIKSGEISETIRVYQTGQNILLLSKNQYPVTDKGETIAIEIKSNFSFDVQMPEVNWVKEEVESRGLSSHTLYYKILPNESYDKRSAEIIYFDRNSALKDTLKIIQAQKDALIISTKEYEVKSEGEIIDIELNTNIEYEYHIQDSCNWIAFIENRSRSLSTHKLTFKIDKNEELYSRSSIIYFSNKEKTLSDSIKITQSGNIKEIHVSEAGTLSKYINNEDKWNLKALKISGPINGTDIRFILEMVGYSNDPESEQEGALTILDLSNARIVEGGEHYYMDWLGRKYYTQNDHLSDYMFWYSNLQHIVLPKDIKVVGKYALGWCYELQSVKLFNSIEKLDDRAFCSSSKLETIDIPIGVTYIGEQAFAGTNLNSVFIPNSVTHIGKEAFYNSKLSSIDIPNTIEFLGHGLFAECDLLKEFRGAYASEDKKCFIYKDTLIAYANANPNSTYNIPNNVISIATSAFSSCKHLKSIIIPNSVKHIKNSAFCLLSITSIEIPNSVTTLEGQILENCDSIVAFYGNFSTTDNKCLVYDNKIINYAVNNQDDNYKVPDGIISIGKSAFSKAKNLKSVYLPNSVTKIEDNAFYYCYRLTKIELSKNIVSIGNNAFQYCFNLPSIELSEKITSIGSSAFVQCEKLATFNIPKSVRTIGEQAFRDCI